MVLPLSYRTLCIRRQARALLPLACGVRPRARATCLLSRAHHTPGLGNLPLYDTLALRRGTRIYCAPTAPPPPLAAPHCIAHAKNLPPPLFGERRRAPHCRTPLHGHNRTTHARITTALPPLLFAACLSTARCRSAHHTLRLPRRTYRPGNAFYRAVPAAPFSRRALLLRVHTPYGLLCIFLPPACVHAGGVYGFILVTAAFVLAWPQPGVVGADVTSAHTIPADTSTAYARRAARAQHYHHTACFPTLAHTASTHTPPAYLHFPHLTCTPAPATRAWLARAFVRCA